ncbi:MAG: thiamine-binding protein [Deltaproteobacteria bacterium]|jgi:uncharacterized protein YqgV (UPF0045/DUF77 family)|nr:thiamine-binding protein [Deltaproteobacteria bacterium]MBW2498666.1 thiamine-binding protein [Deltaproteobacteria bacterium]
MPSATPIRAELSIYPLRQEALSPAIDAAVRALRDAGLEPLVGGMSTTVQGDRSTLFAALDRAFEAASEGGDVVMTIHVSNACPS